MTDRLCDEEVTQNSQMLLMGISNIWEFLKF